MEFLQNDRDTFVGKILKNSDTFAGFLVKIAIPLRGKLKKHRYIQCLIFALLLFSFIFVFRYKTTTGEEPSLGKKDQKPRFAR